MPRIIPEELGQLYRQHAPALRLYARQWPAGDEDLVQEAFVKLGQQRCLPEQVLAALRVVESLRIYAVAHDGKLPAQLSEITEVPVPDDPSTGRPFEYEREGDVGILVRQTPDEMTNNSLRYRITVRSN